MRSISPWRQQVSSAPMTRSCIERPGPLAFVGVDRQRGIEQRLLFLRSDSAHAGTIHCFWTRAHLMTVRACNKTLTAMNRYSSSPRVVRLRTCRRRLLNTRRLSGPPKDLTREAGGGCGGTSCYAGRANPARDSALIAGTIVRSATCEPSTRRQFRVCGELPGTADLDWSAYYEFGSRAVEAST